MLTGGLRGSTPQKKLWGNLLKQNPCDQRLYMEYMYSSQAVARQAHQPLDRLQQEASDHSAFFGELVASYESRIIMCSSTRPRVEACRSRASCDCASRVRRQGFGAQSCLCFVGSGTRFMPVPSIRDSVAARGMRSNLELILDSLVMSPLSGRCI